MDIKAKNEIYKKLIKKYGDILTSLTIRDIVLSQNNAYDMEIEICKIYIDELDYNKRYA